MLEFAQLLDTLLFTSSTLSKRRLMAKYFKDRPDPERGLALAALTGGLSFSAAKPGIIRDLIATRVDPVLYTLSRDYVGDMAETVSLIWPSVPSDRRNYQPSLEEVVETLSGKDRKKLKDQLALWLDALDATGRWALLKLLTGNIRIGVSGRLAKTALADAFGADVEAIEQIWHGLEAPYLTLFAWLEGRGEKPVSSGGAAFMPMMLAHPIKETELAEINLDEFQVELKWDGIRVQVVKSHGKVVLYTRTGDDINGTFPDLVTAVEDIKADSFVLDGELLAMENGAVAPFQHLQQRLNRKTVTAKMLDEYPAHIRLYDMLVDGGEDLRTQTLELRRKSLEAWHALHQSPAMDLSGIIAAPTMKDLEKIHEEAREDAKNGVEGLMLKRKDSPYIAGRPRGYWFKWKRTTLTLDCVLMYAQRGSGKRSSFYSDYTFGVWQKDNEAEPKLVPVGKAYSGFTDEELVAIDKWVRSHTSNRFGPVREVETGLVMEIEFDSIHPSARHKSGVAMRFPRVHRVRWDKPPAEANLLSDALSLVT
jgi:DNA ligase-1